MTVIESLPHALHEWLSLPLQALQSPLSAIVLFAFGAIHVLLPGHGKMLLAARQIGMTDKNTGLTVLDAFTFAAARALSAFALVIATIYAARAFGISIPVQTLRLLAGAALVGIGLHLLLHTLLPNRQKRQTTTDGTLQPVTRRQLNRSLVLLAITPEPVALAITSFGVAQFNITASAIGILCLALGMGTTLSLTTLFAGRSTRYAPKIVAWSGVLIGLILALSGAIVIADTL